MKIGYLTSEYPHLNTGISGGIGTSIKILAHSLIRLGHEVIVFIYGQSDDSVFFDNKIKGVKIKNIRFKGLSWYLTRKKIQRIINYYVTHNNLQIVEAPDWTGITAFMNLKCPLVIKLHGSDTYFCHLEGRKVKKWNYFLEKKALTNADAHISVSAFTAHLTNKVFGLKFDYKIIPNGIEVNKTDGTKLISSDHDRILYVGTLIRKKGVLELPLIFNEVVKLNKSAELLIVGGDTADIKTGSRSTWDLMKPLFSPEAFKQVNYQGRVPYDRMREFYKSAKVCVFPSYAEAFPVSWIEAMAMSKAVVASDIGWANEVIEDGISGILCNPADHEKFANKILVILNDNQLRIYLGNNARSRVEKNFSAEIIAEKTINFYKRVIDSRK